MACFYDKVYINKDGSLNYILSGDSMEDTHVQNITYKILPKSKRDLSMVKDTDYNEIDTHKLSHEDFLLSQEINGLENEISLLKDKEIILYLISEMLHNKEDREVTFTDNEVSIMLSKDRVFTPYYGGECPNISEMEHFIDYLSTKAWIKVFNKPARKTDGKVSEYFSKKNNTHTHWSTRGKTSEVLSIKCP